MQKCWKLWESGKINKIKKFVVGDITKQNFVIRQRYTCMLYNEGANTGSNNYNINIYMKNKIKSLINENKGLSTLPK